MEKKLVPVVIGLDEKSWEEKIDKVEKWFGQLLMIQSSFQQLAEKTAEKIGEVHIRTAIVEMAKEAKVHEQQIEELYTIIGRDSSEVL